MDIDDGHADGIKHTTADRKSDNGPTDDVDDEDDNDDDNDSAELRKVLDMSNDDENTLPKMNNTLFKDPQVTHDDVERKTTVGCGMSDLQVELCKFPPLPSPRHSTKRQESNVGISLVIFLSLAFIGIVHGIALTAIGGIEQDTTVWWTFFILVYAEAVIAMTCLVGLLCSDPGVVVRSIENSFPIPVQCEAWIQAHVEGRPNSIDPPSEYYIASSNPSNPGDTYCTRCLVWRRFRYSTKYFHCTVCQRCVVDFDHHCSLFGRCVAGTWLRGNYKYFAVIIVVGGAGYLTSVVSLLWSLSLRYKQQIAIPVCLFLVWLTTGIFMGRLCTGACMWCRTLAVACTNEIRKYLKT